MPKASFVRVGFQPLIVNIFSMKKSVSSVRSARGVPFLNRYVSSYISNDVVFFVFCCVREVKPGRVMACVWDFAGSEAH